MCRWCYCNCRGYCCCYSLFMCAADELLLYSGGYHLGALQVGCGARHCEKEPLPPYAFPLLLAPPTAFAVDGTSKSSNSSQSSYSSSSSSSRMTFASALQTRGNNRALLLSGPQACSGIFTTIDDISFAGYKFVSLLLLLHKLLAMLLLLRAMLLLVSTVGSVCVLSFSKL